MFIVPQKNISTKSFIDRVIFHYLQINASAANFQKSICRQNKMMVVMKWGNHKIFSY